MNRSVATWIKERNVCVDKEQRIRNLLVVYGNLTNSDIRNVDTETLLVRVLRQINSEQIEYRAGGDTTTTITKEFRNYVVTDELGNFSLVSNEQPQKKTTPQALKTLIENKPSYNNPETVRAYLNQVTRLLAELDPRTFPVQTELTIIAQNYGSMSSVSVDVDELARERDRLRVQTSELQKENANLTQLLNEARLRTGRLQANCDNLRRELDNALTVPGSIVEDLSRNIPEQQLYEPTTTDEQLRECLAKVRALEEQLAARPTPPSPPSPPPPAPPTTPPPPTEEVTMLTLENDSLKEVIQRTRAEMVRLQEALTVYYNAMEAYKNVSAANVELGLDSVEIAAAGNNDAYEGVRRINAIIRNLYDILYKAREECNVAAQNNTRLNEELQEYRAAFQTNQMSLMDQIQTLTDSKNRLTQQMTQMSDTLEKTKQSLDICLQEHEDMIVTKNTELAGVRAQLNECINDLNNAQDINNIEPMFFEESLESCSQDFYNLFKSHKMFQVIKDFVENVMITLNVPPNYIDRWVRHEVLTKQMIDDAEDQILQTIHVERLSRIVDRSDVGVSATVEQTERGVGASVERVDRGVGDILERVDRGIMATSPVGDTLERASPSPPPPPRRRESPVRERSPLRSPSSPPPRRKVTPPPPPPPQLKRKAPSPEVERKKVATTTTTPRRVALVSQPLDPERKKALMEAQQQQPRVRNVGKMGRITLVSKPLEKNVEPQSVINTQTPPNVTTTPTTTPPITTTTAPTFEIKPKPTVTTTTTTTTTPRKKLPMYDTAPVKAKKPKPARRVVLSGPKDLVGQMSEMIKWHRVLYLYHVNIITNMKIYEKYFSNYKRWLDVKDYYCNNAPVPAIPPSLVVLPFNDDIPQGRVTDSKLSTMTDLCYDAAQNLSNMSSSLRVANDFVQNTIKYDELLRKDFCSSDLPQLPPPPTNLIPIPNLEELEKESKLNTWFSGQTYTKLKKPKTLFSNPEEVKKTQKSLVSRYKNKNIYIGSIVDDTDVPEQDVDWYERMSRELDFPSSTTPKPSTNTKIQRKPAPEKIVIKGKTDREKLKEIEELLDSDIDFTPEQWDYLDDMKEKLVEKLETTQPSAPEPIPSTSSAPDIVKLEVKMEDDAQLLQEYDFDAMMQRLNEESEDIEKQLT
uniref:ORF040 n=1 Tax=Spodoptera frugiperda granulovirus TaxID=307454 RepID=A0A346QVV9_9BBAC|nr:ORF040 [Spodoptera frugiperda granulovirus]